MTPVRLILPGERRSSAAIANRPVVDMLTGSGYGADGSDFAGFGKMAWPELVGTETGVTNTAFPYGDARRYGMVGGGADDTTALANALFASMAVDYPFVGKTRVRPQHPGAFQGLMAALDQEQESIAIQVLGDSTGDSTNEWPYLLGQWLATHFPNWTVKHELFNDATQKYDAPTTLQTGPLGERYLQIPTGGHASYLPDSDIPQFTSDLDIAIEVAPDTWTSGTRTLLAKLTATGNQRSFVVQLNSVGRLNYQWSADGIATTLKAVGSTIPGQADGQRVWIRFTHDVDDGAGNNVFAVYYGSDGVNWTLLQSFTTAGTTSIFDSTRKWEIGGRDNAEILAGKYYNIVIRDGIDGPVIAPQQLDGWLRGITGTTATYGGSPVLRIVNGSVPSQGISYLSNVTRFPKLTPLWGQVIVFISTSHNELEVHGNGYIASLDAWLAQIQARLPHAHVVVSTQNPRIAPATWIREQTIRRRQLISWAAKNSLGLVDAFRAFESDGRALSTLIDVGGVHPTSAGAIVWAQAVEASIVNRE